MLNDFLSFYCEGDKKIRLEHVVRACVCACARVHVCPGAGVRPPLLKANGAIRVTIHLNKDGRRVSSSCTEMKLFYLSLFDDVLF